MAKTTMISVKLDKKLKDAAQKMASDLGLPLGTLINAYLRQFVRQKEVTLSLVETPSTSLRKAIVDADVEYRSGKVKKFNSAESFLEDLGA